MNPQPPHAHSHSRPAIDGQKVAVVSALMAFGRVLLLWIGMLGGGVLLAQDTPAEAVPVETGGSTLVEEPLSSSPAPEAAVPQPGAPKVSKISTNVIDMIDALGVWVVPFALASIIFLWFTVDRLVMLRTGRVIPRPFVQRFLRLLEDGEMEQDEALEVCLENGSPIANIFAHAVRKWGKPSVEVEQAIIDGGERQVSELRKNLRVLHGIHTITPMLGLLGTVWGMLDSFSQIAFAGAMGQTDQLASGIALALVTTVVGLLIAIPALIMYMYFSGKIDSLVMQMDDLSQRVVYCISAEGLVGRMGRAKKMMNSPTKGDSEPVSGRKR
ncbi:MAG: MotA/TolQ/ExbB proton channel family protein [Planctomycetaceae bacterium]